MRTPIFFKAMDKATRYEIGSLTQRIVTVSDIVVNIKPDVAIILAIVSHVLQKRLDSICYL